jgi:hypothetical protein
VDATFRDKRNNVTKRSSEGNVDNSRASFDDNVTIRTAIAKEMLQAKNISNIIVGKGIIRVPRTATNPKANIKLLYDNKELSNEPVFFNIEELFFSEPIIVKSFNYYLQKYLY